jgi:hypothetical protein
MKIFILLAILASVVFSEDKKDSWITGIYGPYPGVDATRLKKLEQVKVDRLKEQEKLKIKLKRLELDLKELLLEGAELPALWDNCSKRGELWAKIQYAQIKADAKRRKTLNNDEWDKYLIWKLNMEAKRVSEKYKHQSEYEKKIVKPLRKTDDCPYIVEGIIEYYKHGKLVAVVDYGDGACDNKATKKTDGKTYEFKLGK